MITQTPTMRRAATLGVMFSALFLHAAPAAAQSLPDPSAPEVADYPPLSPAALELRDTLRRTLGAKSPALAGYDSRRFVPIWLSSDGTANDKARELIAVLSDAHDHALPVGRYDAEALADRLDEGSPGLEAALTKAFVTYATDISSGALEPRDIDRELYIFPQRPDLAALVEEAGDTRDIGALLAGLAPDDPLYRRLLDRLAGFRSKHEEELWGPSVRKGRTLRPGDRHARVVQVRERLAAMGDLDMDVYKDYALPAEEKDGARVASADVQSDVQKPTFDPEVFDEPLVDAIRQFQGRHGLNQDGVIGPATLAQLNTSPKTRAEQIAVNLERLRWLNRDLGDRHILVNLAGFTMAVIEDDNPVFTSRVVVGKARKHRTPEFSDTMTHMVINPSWHVPRSIATKEILPKLQENPNYLIDNDMQIIGADIEDVDWTEITADSFPGRIRQQPGAGNALGTVKFMFPNRFSIYLHDTPSRRLFQRDIRAYSHGCVRVEKPHEFAAYLLTGQEADPVGFFNRVLARGRERHVNLDNPLPVHLTYRTAWIDRDGTEHFRGDIYGRDRSVVRALASAGVTVLD